MVEKDRETRRAGGWGGHCDMLPSRYDMALAVLNLQDCGYPHNVYTHTHTQKGGPAEGWAECKGNKEGNRVTMDITYFRHV